MFEQKSHGAGLGRVFDIRVIAVRGENEHFGGGNGFEHLPGGFQAVEQRHGDVHQHHGGTKFFDQGDRLAAVLRFADHFKVVFEFQHLAKTFAHNRVVFRQQNSDSFHRDSRFGCATSISEFFAPPRARLAEGNLRQDGGAFAAVRIRR